MERTGVPASITLAQGLLESNSGQSALAVKANNHFGVKCHKDWDGGKYLQDAEERNECFRAYSSPEASFHDHSDFIRYRDRYKSLFSLEQTDYKSWAKGLKEAGYATDPAYPQKLIKLIEDYELYRFDVAVEIEVPDPLEVETPVVIETVGLEEESGTVQYREQHNFSLSRDIYSQNGVPFVYAMAGETYESLAARFNLFQKEILRFNDLERTEPLVAGDIVYLKAKKKTGAKGVDKYIVGDDGQVTLRDISQRFGIRLSSLQKMNPYAVGSALEPGDTVNLRPAK